MSDNPIPEFLSEPAKRISAEGVKMTEQDLVDQVERDARRLCVSLAEASEAGASSLVMPVLIRVFQEAGMIPADLDVGSLLGMLR